MIDVCVALSFLKAGLFNSNGGGHFCLNICYVQIPSSVNSDAIWQREVVLLPVSDQRAAVDLAADALLHHLSPVELQARVHRVHALSGQVRDGGGKAPPAPDSRSSV